MKPYRRRATVAALGCVAFAGCGSDDPVELLARAAPYRLVEPRLSGPFPAHDCNGSRAGTACALPAAGTSEFDALAAATSRVRERARAGGNRALQAVALSELLWSAGDAAPLDRADSVLASLAEASPGDADILADLAAVQLVRASNEGGAHDAARALDHTERALRRTPDHAAALFNRALALQFLGVDHAASEAWRDYLAADSRSAWADIARARQAELRSQGLQASARRGSMRDLRELVMDSVLPAWGSGHLARAPDADRRLAVADSLSGLLMDSSARRIVGDVRDAVADGRADGLARALTAFGSGRRHYLDARDSAARQDFIAARRSAIPHSAVLRDWTDLWLASIELGTDLRSARARATGILERRSPDESPTLVGLAQWIRGVVEGREGRAARALRDHEASVGTMERSGENSYSAFLWSLVAEDRTGLGDERGAWEARSRAFIAFQAGGDSLRYQASLLEAAEALRRAGLTHAGLRLQEAGIAVAPSTTPPNLVAEALTRRAVLRGAVGDSAQALSDLAEARRIAESVDHTPTRLRTLSDVWRAEAALNAIRLEASTRVLALLDSAIVLHERRGESYFLRDLYLDRSRLLMREGEVDRARSDLTAALDHLDRGRDSTAAPVDAVRSAAVADRAVDTAFELELTHTWAPWSALQALERVRAIATPWLSGAIDVATRPERYVPPGTAIVVFATLDDDLVAWVIRADGRWAVSTPADRASVRAAVEHLTATARRGRSRDQVRAAADAASALLLPDTVRALVGPRNVVVIPDAALGGTPFSLLRAGDRWWLQDRTVAVSPSLALALAPARPSDQPPSGWVFAGDPVPGPSMADRFPPLPGARRELSALREVRPDAVTVTGERLTVASLLAELEEPRELLHFAGHAIANAESPGGSHLVLSPSAADPSDPGLLTAAELAAAPIRGPVTVVLTACQSVAPAASDTGGFQGLALPFLRHGTRAVVGALWPVEDDATARLAVEFHRRLSRGATAAEALRAAQADALADGSVPVSVWAAFQVVVGNGGRPSVDIDAP